MFLFFLGIMLFKTTKNSFNETTTNENVHLFRIKCYAFKNVDKFQLN
jgi:hypothetical protein